MNDSTELIRPTCACGWEGSLAPTEAEANGRVGNHQRSKACPYADTRDLPPAGDWRDGPVACRPMLDDLFFPDTYSTKAEIEEALSACRRCPVQRACLDEALATPEEHDHGILGGATEKDRRRIRKLNLTGQAAADWVEDRHPPLLVDAS
ncbi:WhiB family transcriptional regulator [Ornithinimicrobium sp. LYQ92]|uniref:WhiB family transcriptional regulator n=1 Tax=Serinicoccus sp. LYQ92 TaxID=3378798 RepID=UPI00385508AA